MSKRMQRALPLRWTEAHTEELPAIEALQREHKVEIVEVVIGRRIVTLWRKAQT